MVVVSESVLKHILRKHRDFVKLMGLESIETLEKIIRWVVEAPDEVYADLLGTKYFLKKIDELHVNVVVVNDRVKTAYLIGPETYRRLRERRWVRRLY
jgi:3-keto-L-gulonate-6-phosphate decarboxylase